MALTSARQILNKKILGGGSSEDIQELKVEVAALSASVLTIGEKVENITEYSTDEKVVGKWIDGSDIYEKTIVLDQAVTTTANQWSATGITIENADMIVNAKIILNTPANENAAVTVIARNDSGIKIYDSIQLVFTTLIIQYTKTAAESKKKTKKK